MTTGTSFSPQAASAAYVSPWQVWRDRAAARAAAAQHAASRPRLTDQEFAERYLKGTSLFPLHGPSRWFDFALFHRELSALADVHTQLLIHISREHAKSSLFSVIRPLRLICENRDVRMVVIGKTVGFARKLVGTVMRQLAANERLIADYGAFEPSMRTRRERRWQWGDENLTVLRSSGAKEPTLQAVGRGGQIVGGRIDVVILDDVEDSQSTWTADSREKTHHWFKNDVQPVLTAQGSCWVIATPQHETDLVGRLKAEGGWHYVNVPAERVMADGDEPQGTGDGKARGDARIRRVSAWPAKWSVYYRDCVVRRLELRGASEQSLAAEAKDRECLACPVYNKSLGDVDGVGCLTGKRLHQHGPTFYRLAYLVQLEALAGDLFDSRWFRFYGPDQVRRIDGAWSWLEPKPGGDGFRAHPLEVVMGVDPAISDKDEKSDSEHSDFAITVMGLVRELRHKILLDAFSARIDAPSQVLRIGEMQAAWGARFTAIESNAYQKSLGQHVKKDYPAVRVHEVKSFADKRLKFSGLTGDCLAGRVLLPSEVAEAVAPADRSHRAQHAARAQRCAAILKQAVAFPRGSHDDLLDAWWLAEQALGKRLMFEQPAGMVREYEGRLAEIVDDCDRDPGGWTRFDARLPLRQQGIGF